MNRKKLMEGLKEGDLAVVALGLLAQLEGSQAGGLYYLKGGLHEKEGRGREGFDEGASSGYSFSPGEAVARALLEEIRSAERRSSSRYGEGGGHSAARGSAGLEGEFGSDAQANDPVFRSGEGFKPGMDLERYLRHRGYKRGGYEFPGGEAAGGAEGGFVREVLTESQELGSNGLPEKLSERFSRDARRYDGAFERY